MENEIQLWPVVKLFFYDTRMIDWCNRLGLAIKEDYYIETTVKDLNRILKLKTHSFFFKEEKYATLFKMSFSHVLL
jgi:hypothetical protein